MTLFAKAAKGRTVVFDRNSFGCFGGRVGLGLGNPYAYFPGGIECFCYFLSTKNINWEPKKESTESKRDFVGNDFIENLVHGKEYQKTTALLTEVLEQLPIMDIPAQYVNNMPVVDIPYQYIVVKPLKDVDVEKEAPVTIIFLISSDQFSSLFALTNHGREWHESVSIPFAAGCQTLGIFPYREVNSENPKAVIGLTDISAQKYIEQQLGIDLLSFAIPFKMFKEMEANVEEGINDGK